MCGIVGFIYFDKEKPAELDKITNMADIIKHRGPDGEGYYIKNNLALGHRRLAIIDLESGQQPMIEGDEELVIVFNGEIYNYVELKKELQSLGYKFKTSSDTEVILKAYKEWGYDCQNKFNGMWAFAIWDSKIKTLFMSRDRIGEKPLYYSIFNNAFVFASEIKSIFQFGVPKELNLEMMELYLTFSNIPEPYSFYKNVQKLKAGHYLIFNENNLVELKYWELPLITDQNIKQNKKKILDEFQYLLEDSVKIRMRSDVPFGAFLSGGLDSSTIVAIMSNLSKYPIETFTMGFQEKEFDESGLARLVSEKYNCNFNLGTVKADSFFNVLNDISFHYDEPFGDSSAIAVGEISKFAREKVKMILTGDGGDEVLSGYTVYQGIKFAELYNKVPHPIHLINGFLFNRLSTLFSGQLKYRFNRINNVINSSKLEFIDMLIEKASCISHKAVLNICNNIKSRISVKDFISDFLKNYPVLSPFYKQMYFNLKISLPNDMLVKVDRMSMANSLETRIPFLDHRLIEFMVLVDKNIKMEGFERKSVLRKIYSDYLPPQLLKAKKRGFGTPVREWFKNKDINNYLENLVNSQKILNKNKIKEILSLNNNNKNDFGNFLWMIAVLFYSLKEK